MNQKQRWITTPIGRMRLVATDEALVGVYFEDHRPAPANASAVDGDSPILDLAERALASYFRGDERGLDVPLAPAGTPFQLRVWQALRSIERGTTISYAELAERVGSPKAVRAVGSANARNPLSIFVPCHRVVGKDGELRGYAGGSAAKAWLLSHEAAA